MSRPRARASDLRHHALGPPPRVLSDIPANVVIDRATCGAATTRVGADLDTPMRNAPNAGAFRDGLVAHPQDVEPAFEGDEDQEVFSLRGSPPSSMARSEDVGGRYVNRDYFSDDSDSGDESRGLRKGAKVRHERFGEGVVRQVLPSVDRAVVAFFPRGARRKSSSATCGWRDRYFLKNFWNRPGFGAADCAGACDCDAAVTPRMS